MENRVYKIFRPDEWVNFQKRGQFDGSADDQRDGFIHLSTLDQIDGTLAKHFSGAPVLVLAAIETANIAANLKWETSRGGALFPHFYGRLSREAIAAHCEISQDNQGAFPRAQTLTI